MHVKKHDGSQLKLTLIERARDIMWVKHDSIRTECASINWMCRDIFCRDTRHPERVGMVHERDVDDGYGRVDLPHACEATMASGARSRRCMCT